MGKVYALGVGSTGFKKWPDRSFRELGNDVCKSTLSDAGLEDGRAVSQVIFGNCAMGAWGQANIRGQVALGDLLQSEWFAPGTPIVNVEGGCATGSLALHQGFQAVASGLHDVVLAVGVEKTWMPDDPAKSFALFAGGIDQLHRHEWRTFFHEAGRSTGQGFEPDPRRIIFLDIHALQARDHMARYGTTAEQLAGVSAKNRANAVQNEKAQFRRETSVEDVLNDLPIVPPLTRSMCAPISDGAAAVLLCSEAFMAAEPGRRDRAIRLRACALAGGRYRAIDAPSVVAHAAQAAYTQSGLTADEIQIAEVHDATAFCELLHYEALGFCQPGESGAYLDSGATRSTGDRPVNLSGGLISKGHPLAATGLSMIDELVTHLRGEAGARQAANTPTLALAQNAGGLIGFDEALCGVTILSRE